MVRNKFVFVTFAVMSFALPLRAQITFVQAASKDCGTVSSCTLAFEANNASGNLLVVAVRSGSMTTKVTVSDSQTNTYVAQISRNQTRNGHTLTIAYAANVKPGANKVSVTLSGGTTMRVAIHEYGGIVPSDPVDAFSSSEGSSLNIVNQPRMTSRA